MRLIIRLSEVIEVIEVNEVNDNSSAADIVHQSIVDRSSLLALLAKNFERSDNFDYFDNFKLFITS
jgi:hypothetical protein